MSVPRVTVTPRVVDAQEFAAIISLVQLGRVPEAWARFQAASLSDGALARFGGAVNAALAAAEQPALPPPTGRIDMSIPFGNFSRHEIPTLMGEVVHVAFSFPADADTYAVAGYIAAFEFRGPPKQRIASITREPDDPGAADQSRALVSPGGTTATAYINAGHAQGLAADGTLHLLPGVTYYFNVRNFTSLDTNQPAAVQLIWPHN